MIGDTVFTGGQAIQIIKQPDWFTSVYRPVIFRIQSTVTDHPELTIKAELFYRNNLYDPFVLLCTKYEKLYPSSNYYQFNFAKNLQTVLSFDRQLYPALSIVTPNPCSIAEYQVRFTQIYMDTNGVLQDYTAMNSDILKAVQATRQHSEAQYLSDYIIYGGDITGGDKTDFSKDFNSSFS